MSHMQPNGYHEAGVGITIAEVHPFYVVDIRPGGPAQMGGCICVGDMLQKVDGHELTRTMTGNDVRAKVIGPVETVVELMFRENPRRTERGAYRVRLRRQAAAQGGATLVSTYAMPPPEAPPPGFGGVVYNDDFPVEDSERATKHQYDPRKKQWARTCINVVVSKKKFAEGVMREAYHMQDLSVLGDDRLYVLKMSKESNENPQTYFDDVQMQMEAKMYAEYYNAQNPPKMVDFLDAYVLTLIDRPGKPICAVEKFINGEYKKYNNNWDWSDLQRNTPQAFSHFSYERSQHTILICDIQGVGDTWTDPQIHSHNSEGYGKGNLGQEGIQKFLESHQCNEICALLRLPVRQLKAASAEATRVRPPLNAGTRLAAGEGGARVGGAGAGRGHASGLLGPDQDAEAWRKNAELEREKRKNAELTQELERIKSEFEALQQHAGGAAASGEARHGDGGRGREGDIEKLIEYGFDPSLAERALQHESVFEAAVEWCLSSATAAKLDLQPQARAPNIANGVNQRPPQRELPVPPTGASKAKTVSTYTNGDQRLEKEWKEQEKLNKQVGELVFAEPSCEKGPGLREWIGVVLGPKGSAYDGYAFQVSISMPDRYPIAPPIVKFISKVFHPNVWGQSNERFGEICLSSLSTEWSPAFRVRQVLLSVYGLLETPNEQSPLFQMAGDILASNPALFAKYVREWAQNGAALNGEQVKSLHEMGYSTRRIVGALVETCGDLEQAVDLMQNERWQPRVLVKAGSGEGVAQAEAVGWAAAPGIDASMRNRDAQLHQQRAVGQGFIQQQQQQLLQHQQHGRSAKPPPYDQVLPHGWREYKDEKSGRVYYHHQQSKTTQWERPVAANV